MNVTTMETNAQEKLAALILECVPISHLVGAWRFVLGYFADALDLTLAVPFPLHRYRERTNERIATLRAQPHGARWDSLAKQVIYAWSATGSDMPRSMRLLYVAFFPDQTLHDYAHAWGCTPRTAWTWLRKAQAYLAAFDARAVLARYMPVALASQLGLFGGSTPIPEPAPEPAVLVPPHHPAPKRPELEPETPPEEPGDDTAREILEQWPGAPTSDVHYRAIRRALRSHAPDDVRLISTWLDHRLLSMEQVNAAKGLPAYQRQRAFLLQKGAPYHLPVSALRAANIDANLMHARAWDAAGRPPLDEEIHAAHEERRARELRRALVELDRRHDDTFELDLANPEHLTVELIGRQFAAETAHMRPWNLPQARKGQNLADKLEGFAVWTDEGWDQPTPYLQDDLVLLLVQRGMITTTADGTHPYPAVHVDPLVLSIGFQTRRRV